MKKLGLKDIVNDVYRALDAKAYLSALALTLTIPDTLSQITYPELEGKGNVRERYVRWMEEYYVCKPKTFEDKYSECSRLMNEVINRLDGDFFYELRNSFLHSDSNDVSKKMSDLDFELSFSNGCITSVSESNGGYTKHHVLSVPDFCERICATTEQLIEQWGCDDEKQAQLKKFQIKLCHFDDDF